MTYHYLNLPCRYTTEQAAHIYKSVNRNRVLGFPPLTLLCHGYTQTGSVATGLSQVITVTFEPKGFTERAPDGKPVYEAKDW